MQKWEVYAKLIQDLLCLKIIWEQALFFRWYFGESVSDPLPSGEVRKMTNTVCTMEIVNCQSCRKVQFKFIVENWSDIFCSMN